MYLEKKEINTETCVHWRRLKTEAHGHDCENYESVSEDFSDTERICLALLLYLFSLKNVLFQFVMLSKNNDYYEFKDIFKMLSKCAGNTSKDVEKWKRILVLRTKIQKTKIYYFFVFLSEA